MTKEIIDLNSVRSRKALLSKTLNKSTTNLLFGLSVLLLGSGLAIIILFHIREGYFLITLAIACFMLASWGRWDLADLKPDTKTISGRLSNEILASLDKSTNNPRSVWQKTSNHWQAYFFTNHLFISPQVIENLLSDQPADLALALDKAEELATNNHDDSIELGYLTAGLILSSPDLVEFLGQQKFSKKDVEEITNWLGRTLQAISKEKQNFGGIGRDWSFGFTNFLNRFGYNLSLEILNHGLNFGWLTSSSEVKSIESALANNSNAVVIIGPTGIGKTSRVYALAQRLMEGKTNKKVAYHQIIQLDASTILSNAKSPGQLEQIFINIANEASHAGHIILFLDDAELFFNQGSGSINAAAILQPFLQDRSVQFILALTPEDYQRLRTNNAAVANLLTPIIISELPEDSIMNILEDSTIGMEHKYNCLITYSALKSAYRLSGRYNSEEAYPGRAIKLLEQSITLSNAKVITEENIEAAIEQTQGVKVTSAGPVEAENLIHLEDQIHQLMVNQTEAVSAVASALRRARAGIADPKRPIGSFLFLGPTGVGKTELAKAVATTYFGSVKSIIRLDMSEYQQEKDVSRLLNAGSDNAVSFLMEIRRQPFSVVLLDEVEKANPNILNLLLQLLDEGQLTDTSGKAASFKDAVVIATSNAGASLIRDQIKQGGSLEAFKEILTDELSKQNIFKAELLNRFDDIILFRPLNNDELGLVVNLLLKDINANLAHQNISIELSTEAIAKVVRIGNDERYGARPMRRALQRGVEDTIAQKILKGEVNPGDKVTLNDSDINL